MKNKFLYIPFLALGLGLVACEPEFKDEINAGTYTNGEADFTTYVAIGNSLTAGYMDGTVFRSGQHNSYPNILAKQFKLVGGGAFTQPSYDDDVNDLGGLILMGTPQTLTRMVINMSTGGPQNLAGTPTIEISKLQQKAYNNMGVPGAKSFHLLASGYGNLQGLATKTANPYFVRHATTPTTTVLADAMSMNPTFFTNWIGSNDVLAYALSGGTGVDQKGNTNPATYGSDDITDPNVFAQVYATIMNTLTANGAKGVVATIPSVTSIPYFTTVKYNPLSVAALGEAAGINTINQSLYGPMKAILTAVGAGDRIELLSTTSANPVIIVDKTLPNLSAQITAVASQVPELAPLAGYLGSTFGQVRQANKNDLILLTASSAIGKTTTLPTGVPATLGVVGVTYPLGDALVLLPSEQQAITEATTAFNQIIRQIAASKSIPVADMNRIMNDLVAGLRNSDGQIYTADYFKGTGNLNTVMFSLDGVHPNSRGYAFVANEIIKVINQNYKARIPFVNVADYQGPKLVPSN